jgi:glycosyltransferase involved in cell wall biosynthesis
MGNATLMDRPTATTPKLRIAAFTYSYVPMMTGISSLVHERIACLLQQGHTVRLFHPQVPEGKERCARDAPGLDHLAALGDFSAVAFPTVRNPLRRSFPDPASYRVWDDTQLLSDFVPDVITVDEAAGMFGAASGWLRGYGKPVGVRYARQHRIPCVNLLQTDWQGYGEQYIGKFAMSVCLPAARRIMQPVVDGYDANLSPSRFLMRRNAPIYGRKVSHLSFHGVDCVRYSPQNHRFDPLPNDDAPLILSAGRIAREKNIWKLVEAFDHVRKAIPSVRLAILGRGPLHARLQHVVSKWGSDVIMPGAVFGNELRGWYARADVYWSASTTENFSASILESLASGTPVVAVAAGGNTEQVVDGVCGYLPPVNDAARMAERTIKLFKNRTLLESMSSEARDRALELNVNAATGRLVLRLRQMMQHSVRPLHAMP